MTPRKPKAMVWHPAAEAFPMMSEEELADLAADIKGRGLLSPIVVLPDGTGLDGRNREAACLLAKVSLTTVVYEGDDPVGFVLAANVHRRHMSKGARAMVTVKACESTSTKYSQRQLAAGTDVSQSYIKQATVVFEHAPELVDAVIAGASLNEAYAFAVAVKQAAEAAEQHEVQRAKREAAEVARREKLIERRKAEVLATVEEIGPAVPLPPMPDVPTTKIEVPDVVGAGLDAALIDQKAVLDLLIALRSKLMTIKVPPGNAMTELYVKGVESGVTRLIAAATAVLERHIAAIPTTKLRSVQ